MAKRDKNGNLITYPNLLKKLYVDTYKERLKIREIKPELLDLYFLKSEFFDLSRPIRADLNKTLDCRRIG